MEEHNYLLTILKGNSGFLILAEDAICQVQESGNEETR